MLFSGRSAMSLPIRSMASSKASAILLIEGGFGQLEAGLEDLLHAATSAASARAVLYPCSNHSKLPQWSKIRKCVLSLAGAEQVLAEPGAAADHLPELDVGVRPAWRRPG